MTDLARIQAEIHEEVRRRRAAGDFPPGLERELDALFLRYAPAMTGGDFTQVLERAERASFIHADVPTLSRHRALSVVKQALRTAMAFYVRFLAQQVTSFAGAITRAVQLLGGRVDRLEQLTVVAAARALAETRARPDVDLSPWIGIVSDALRDVKGRVLHAECASGDLLAALVDSGHDAYGTEPDEDMALAAASAGLDVRADDVMTHLRAVPEGSLGALVLSGVVDRLPVGEVLQLADLAAATLSSGGRLVIVSTGPAAWARTLDPVVADLSPGRPLHPETWDHLLSGRGFTGVSMINGGGPALQSLPDGEPGAAVHNANIARLNQVLFSPPSYAVIATR